MALSPSVEITRLLRAESDGDGEALDRLTPLVYRELHHVAHRYMLRERQGRTLQTTALVNEACLRPMDVGDMRWEHRTHFFAVSGRIMRRILVDAALSRDAARRGGPVPRLELDEVPDLSVQCGG